MADKDTINRGLAIQFESIGSKKLNADINGVDTSLSKLGKKGSTSLASVDKAAQGTVKSISATGEAMGKALDPVDKMFAGTDKLFSILGKAGAVGAVVGAAVAGIGAAYRALTIDTDKQALAQAKLNEQQELFNGLQKSLTGLSVQQLTKMTTTQIQEYAAANAKLAADTKLLIDNQAQLMVKERELNDVRNESVELNTFQVERLEELDKILRQHSRGQIELSDDLAKQHREERTNLILGGEARRNKLSLLEAEVNAYKLRAEASKVALEFSNKEAKAINTVADALIKKIKIRTTSAKKTKEETKAVEEQVTAWNRLGEAIKNFQIAGVEDPNSFWSRLEEGAKRTGDRIVELGVNAVNTAKDISGALVEATNNQTDALKTMGTQAIETATVNALMGDSFEDVAKKLIEAVAMEAKVEAGKNAAKALFALGEGLLFANPAAIAAAKVYGAAAVAWGVVGGTAGAIAGSIGGSSGGGESSASTSTTSATPTTPERYEGNSSDSGQVSNTFIISTGNIIGTVDQLDDAIKTSMDRISRRSDTRIRRSR